GSTCTCQTGRRRSAQSKQVPTCPLSTDRHLRRRPSSLVRKRSRSDQRKGRLQHAEGRAAAERRPPRGGPPERSRFARIRRQVAPPVFRKQYQLEVEAFRNGLPTVTRKRNEPAARADWLATSGVPATGHR